jgi:hypothetical protein
MPAPVKMKNITAHARASVSHGHIEGVAGIRPAMQFEQSNKTPLAKGRGMELVCPICTLRFRRPYSHAKRVNCNYCSRACANEGRKTGVMVPCVICGTGIYTIPSMVGSLSCCSRECTRVNRRKVGTSRPYRPIEMVAAIDAVRERGNCCLCGANYGPWIVRGIMVIGDAPCPEIDVSAAELWCKRCHLADVSWAGGDAKRRSARRVEIETQEAKP